MAAEMVIRLQTGTTNVDDINVSADPMIRLRLPDSVSDAQIGKALKDAELFTEILGGKPGEVRQILEALSDGDHATARRLALEIGVDENRFQGQEGGLIWFLLIAAALALMAIAAYVSS